MERVFTYQRHLRYADSVVYVFLGVVLPLCWAVPSILYNANYITLRSPTRLSIFLSFTLLLFGALLLMVGRELKHTIFVVTEDGLVVKSPTRIRTMPFSAIDHFRYRRPPLLPWYGELRSGRYVVYLPLVIRDLSRLVKLIRERLEAVGNDDVFDIVEIDEFELRSRVNDLAEERTYRALPILVTVSIYALAVSYLVASRIWGLSAVLALAWGLWGVVTPSLCYLIANAAISRRTLRRLRGGSSGTPEAAPQYVFWGAVFALLYLALGIAYRDVCLYFIL
jgi:hypothetical protein